MPLPEDTKCKETIKHDKQTKIKMKKNQTTEKGNANQINMYLT